MRIKFCFVTVNKYKFLRKQSGLKKLGHKKLETKFLSYDGEAKFHTRNKVMKSN